MILPISANVKGEFKPKAPNFTCPERGRRMLGSYYQAVYLIKSQPSHQSGSTQVSIQ